MKYFFLSAYVALAAHAVHAEIVALSTNRDGSELYFATRLSQRGSGQASTNKLFVLSAGQLKLVEQEREESGTVEYGFLRTELSQREGVRAINRRIYCQGGSSCFFRELSWTTIETPSQTLTFGARASISSNGRFVALFGNTSSAPGIVPPPQSVRLLDLSTGAVTLVGRQAVSEGRIVADDGTVLVSGDNGVRLVKGSTVRELTPQRQMATASLSPDGMRIVYSAGDPPQVRVLDVSTGMDRVLAPGTSPVLAADGRTVSFLNYGGENIQVWLADAISGQVRQFSSEGDGIVDQTISGDATQVFAVTGTGRLLSIHTGSGLATVLLNSPGPQTGLLTTPVPGSYNELRGSFPEGYVPEVSIGTIRAPIIGRSTRGIAIQIPWEAQPGESVAISVTSPETVWERASFYTVAGAAGAALPVGAAGPGGPAYYAIHEDWSGPVSRNNPARPGEIVHMYGTGYGPVDGVMPTGQPTSPHRLYRMTSPCVWRAIGDSGGPRPIEARFAGLAPGLVGLYQFDFHIPANWGGPLFNPYCDFGNGSFLPTAAVEVGTQ